MDYKQLIIEMVQQIDDEKFLKMIYGFVRNMFIEIKK